MPLGRVEPVLPGPPVGVVAPIGGIVIEAAAAGFVRAGAILFAIVPAPAPSPGGEAGARRSDRGARRDRRQDPDWLGRARGPAAPRDRAAQGQDRHRARTLGAPRDADADGGHRRRSQPAPHSGDHGRRAAGEGRPHVVRATVRGFAMVRDTSGRTERRPVIETTLKLGPFERRITRHAHRSRRHAIPHARRPDGARSGRGRRSVPAIPAGTEAAKSQANDDAREREAGNERAGN